MEVLTCIAGLPHPVVDEIRSRSAKPFTGNASSRPIVRPIKSPYGYRAGMSEGYLQELATRIAALNPRDEAAVIVAYVAYPSVETKHFVDSFFPFAIHAPLEPFDPEAGPKAQRRSTLLAYVDGIEVLIGALIERMRAVRDALSGSNFTPLLLPLSNFKSDVLVPEITALFGGLGTAADPRAILDQASQAIAAAHPIQLAGSGRTKTRFYEDGRRLRFNSPGSNRHGMAQQGGTGHQSACLINGRVRLGGPFDSQFHYDCGYARGNVNRAYPNCHAAQTTPANATYVNIAPSDYIR